MGNLETKMVISAEDQASAALKKVHDSMGDVTSKVQSSTKDMAAGFDVVNASIKLATTALAAFATYKLADATKDVAMLAARYETLGVVMGVVGNNTGKSKVEMEAYAVSLQKLGISMIESRQTMTTMAMAHLDLAKASELARMAQDAAVIGNTNSSEALKRLVYGIQSAQVEVLRTMGINVNFENSYRQVAAATNRTVESFSEVEKTAIRMNAVLKESPTIATAYTASMETAGKMIGSFVRYVEDFQVKMGEAFGPATKMLIEAATEAMKQFQVEIVKPDAQKALRDLSESLAKTLVSLSDGLPEKVRDLAGALQTIADMYNKLPADVVGAAGTGLVFSMLFGPQIGALAAGTSYAISQIQKIKHLVEDTFWDGITASPIPKGDVAPDPLRFKVPKDTGPEVIKPWNPEKTIDIKGMKAAETAAKKYETALEDLHAKLEEVQAVGKEEAGFAKLDKYFEKMAKDLGGVTPELQRFYEIAKQKLETESVERYNKAMTDLQIRMGEFTLSSADLERLKLTAKYEEEAIAIRKTGVAVDEQTEGLKRLLDAKLLIITANEKYAEDPYKEDPWIKHLPKKIEASEKADLEIAKNSKKSQEDLAKTVEKINDNMWQSIQSSFASSIEGMFDKGLNSWQDFGNSIVKILEKTFAQIVAAWVMSEAASLFNTSKGTSSNSGSSTGSSWLGALGGAIANYGSKVWDWGASFFADGGKYPANQPFWAGERGPELIFPTGSGQVLSNPDSMAFASAYGVSIPGYASGTIGYSGMATDMGGLAYVSEQTAMALEDLYKDANGLTGAMNKGETASRGETAAKNDATEATGSFRGALNDAGSAIKAGFNSYGATVSALGLVSSVMTGNVLGAAISLAKLGFSIDSIVGSMTDIFGEHVSSSITGTFGGGAIGSSASFGPGDTTGIGGDLGGSKGDTGYGPSGDNGGDSGDSGDNGGDSNGGTNGGTSGGGADGAGQWLMAGDYYGRPGGDMVGNVTVETPITVNVTNNSGTFVNPTAKVTRTDQGTIVELIIDALDRNVGGIRSRMAV